MTIWILLLLGAAAVILALWHFARLDRAGLQFLASALLLALAGYAWQGSPGLAGSPKRAIVREERPPTLFAEHRKEMFGRFDSADAWLTIAENYQRRGKTRDGAGVIRSALRKRPNNAVLWLGLANALILHADGMMTPAAQLAFQRSEILAPDHPGPVFFYGLALAQGGNLDQAESVWRTYLTTRPIDARWRALFEQQFERLAAARALGSRAQ